MAALILIGIVAVALLGRRGDIVTAGIKTAVVMVVAAMTPKGARQQPLLRLVDTAVAIIVGVACKSGGTLLFSVLIGGTAP
jgi:hypothetical protein